MLQTYFLCHYIFSAFKNWKQLSHFRYLTNIRHCLVCGGIRDKVQLPAYILLYSWGPYSLSSTASIHEHFKKEKVTLQNKKKKSTMLLIVSAYLSTSLSIFTASCRELFPHYKQKFAVSKQLPEKISLSEWKTLTKRESRVPDHMKNAQKMVRWCKINQNGTIVKRKKRKKKKEKTFVNHSIEGPCLKTTHIKDIHSNVCLIFKEIQAANSRNCYIKIS